MRLARTRAFGLHRDLYLAIGRRLHEAGRLDAPRDVFYLTVQEIAAYHDGTSVCADLAALARAAPRRVRALRGGGAAQPLRDRRRPSTTATAIAAARRQRRRARRVAVLRGLGCSPGVVEAPLAGDRAAPTTISRSTARS